MTITHLIGNPITHPRINPTANPIGFRSPDPVPDPDPPSTPIPKRLVSDARPTSRLDLEVGQC